MTSLPNRGDTAVYGRLFEIYSEPNQTLLRAVETIISPNAEYLANFFYANLLDISESAPFLDHRLVSERLRDSLANWVRSLFLPTDDASVRQHIQSQQTIGDVHARINVPMRLVNHGFRIIKDEIARILGTSGLDDTLKFQAIVLINDAIDFSASLINETYLLHHMRDETDVQALRMQLTGVSLVVESERLKSSIFDWLRKTITKAYESFPEGNPSLSPIDESELGLWITYKADWILADQPDLLKKMKRQFEQTNICMKKLSNAISGHDRALLLSLIQSLNEKVSEVAATLADFASHAYEMESGKDSLTRLLNRRFLPAILQNMIRASRWTSSLFSILSCDLDNFKEINDSYGHAAGDLVLASFADFLASNVRTTDYVFRLGGDEFMIILGGANAMASLAIANNMLSKLANLKVAIDERTLLNVHVSIGIAQYDRHPDYMHILHDADDALYQAKHMGKNKVFVKPVVT